MTARSRIHAMLPLDEAATKELDARLDAYRAEVVEAVLWNVEQSCGDMAAEAVRDNYPELDA